MHFDDRLATVLRQTPSGQAVAQIQYRQLIDLLGTAPGGDHSERTDAAYLRLADLAGCLSADQRAEVLGEASTRIRNPRLVAQLAADAPPVAFAAIARARLSEDEWLDLIPALPVTARGFLRQRAGLGERAERLLSRLGIHDRGLPPVAIETETAEELVLDEMFEAAPATVDSGPGANVVAFENRYRPPDRRPPAANEAPEETGQAIRAIVRRIEEFRRSRDAAPGFSSEDPELPLEAPHERAERRLAVVDFVSDTTGRIVWADAAAGSMVIGQPLFNETVSFGRIGRILRERQPLRAAEIMLSGAQAIAGLWQADAMPVFEPGGGRFMGYQGRLRRLDGAADAGAAEAASPSRNAGNDRMRVILHELKTPVNAIQGFAELIQQSLIKPVPHGYRALAAGIASEAARILAVLDEFDHLVRLENGQASLGPGQCDLAALVAATVSRLQGHGAPRGSGFELMMPDESAMVSLEAEEAEALLWRLLASLAGEAAPGEVLKVRIRRREGRVDLSVRLPERMAASDDVTLFRSTADSRAAVVSPGMLGTGFALRLAVAEARAAGGSLKRKGDSLRLTLPDLTATQAAHSHGQEATAGT